MTNYWPFEWLIYCNRRHTLKLAFKYIVQKSAKSPVLQLIIPIPSNEKHINTEKHRKNTRAAGCSSKIDNYITAMSGAKREVQATEATSVFHTVKHNQTFN